MLADEIVNPEMERDRQNVSYLTVVEQPNIPSKAFFPDRVQFLLGGIVLGLILGAIRIVFVELKRAAALSPAPQQSGLRAR